jgi:hypothetical protein
MKAMEPKKAKEPVTKTEEKQVVPTAGAFEASKHTVEVLQKFADTLPIPCANQVLQIGLLLLPTYEVRSPETLFTVGILLTSIVNTGSHLDRSTRQGTN